MILRPSIRLDDVVSPFCFPSCLNHNCSTQVLAYLISFAVVLAASIVSKGSIIFVTQQVGRCSIFLQKIHRKTWSLYRLIFSLVPPNFSTIKETVKQRITAVFLLVLKLLGTNKKKISPCPCLCHLCVMMISQADSHQVRC